MNQLRNYIRLMRVKHYIKNILIFMPLFFAGKIYDWNELSVAVTGFFAFCCVSSSVYIFNDLIDLEKDRRHPTKKYRPIASGQVSVKQAVGLIVVCLFLSILVLVVASNLGGSIFLLLYIIVNIAYSVRLKEYPIMDIVLLASGFVIRMFYGGYLTDVPISGWLYLVVVSGSLYMGLGKRRNELRGGNETRKVLKYYNHSFLEKNMYVCVALANVFYALWAMEFRNTCMIWTVPVFMIILMRYSFDVEGDFDGDPVEVILQDRILITLIAAYAVCLSVLLYW